MLLIGQSCNWWIFSGEGGNAVFILVESISCYGKYGNLNLVINAAVFNQPTIILTKWLFPVSSRVVVVSYISQPSNSKGFFCFFLHYSKKLRNTFWQV